MKCKNKMSNTYFEFIKNHSITADNVIPPNLCNQIIKYANSFNYRECRFGGKVDKNVRKSTEIHIKNDNMLDKVWSYVKNYTPQTYNGFKLIGPDYNRLYLLKYGSSDFFKKHYDGYSNDKYRNKSQLTFLLYLNENVEGGATRFFAHDDLKFSPPIDDKDIYDINPKTGSIVIFDHNILHCGMPVIKGYKYCLRFNILYEHYLKFKHPESNGEKYKSVVFMKRKDHKVHLIPSENDKNSAIRWIDVRLKPKVFEIEKESQMFVDCYKGRPPTYLEDYCPNCFEILPIKVNYKNCSGCCSKIKINQTIRELQIKKYNKTK